MSSSPAAFGTGSELAKLLRKERDAIVARFVAEVQRTALPPTGVPRVLLIDHIPQFLDEIIEQLNALESVHIDQETVETSATARHHGEQRRTLGYEFEALIREYGVLRHVIIEFAKTAGARVSLDELNVLLKCLSVGVAEAATEYAKGRDAQLHEEREKLRFLAEAGQILSSSLDYRITLTRVTKLLVPRFADWCAIHIDSEDPEEAVVAHVDPTKVDFARERTRALLSELARSRTAHAAPSQAVLTPEPRGARDESSIEAPSSEGGVAPRSTLVVALHLQQQVFGALILDCGESGRTYSDDDLLFATELSHRVAIAIDNARLYAMSQEERSRVEAASRAKDELLAAVSHELRTPLHAILGWTRVLRQGLADAAERARAFDIIERNAVAQNQLIGDLLDISGANKGKFRLASSRVDLREVVQLALDGIRPAADAKRVRIVWRSELKHANVDGDPDRLQQVFLNLLVNAVKFTPSDGEIRVSLRRIDARAEVTVEDTGIGIDPAFMPHVFESFRQAETGTTRRHGGLGLGLSIAKHLVELHGGSIEASSDGKHQGSQFRVRLPISDAPAPTAEAEAKPAAEHQEHEPNVGGGDGIRILVVDDEPDARDLLAYVLESRGFDVRVAASAQEALGALSSFAPQLVISDIGMPEQDGYDLIRMIRSHATVELRATPAIALTAFGSSEDRARALVAGFNRHMVKPVQPTVLADAVLELTGPPQRD